jgi:hypothetical protein
MYYYNSHGQQAFTLLILEHGLSGDQSMGSATGTIPGKYIRYNDPASAGDMKDFTDACNGRVTECHLGGCDVGAGATGAAFLQKLADDGNMTVTAWDGAKSTDGKIWYTYDGSSLVTKTPAP